MATVEAPEYPDKIDGPVLKVAGVVVLGAIMSILDITVPNVALPTFRTERGSVEVRSPTRTSRGPSLRTRSRSPP